MTKICGYRNCDIDISNRRKNAKYCCRNCKQYERIYRKRRNVFLENVIIQEEERVRMIKLMKILSS